MRILRVFNNNVVLARRENAAAEAADRPGETVGRPGKAADRPGDGDEVVVTGRGIGFHAKQGDKVDESKVVKVFEPADGRDPDHMAELFSAIPAEHIRLTIAAMDAAGMDKTLKDKLTLVTALADHLGGAIRRVLEGIELDYPLSAEVRSLYGEEYALAQKFLEHLNRQLPLQLPAGEAVAFSLHLVNSNFTSGDLSYTYQMTGLIQQMIHVVEHHHGPEFSLDIVSMGRFITHLRYLFVRISQHKQLADSQEAISEAIFRSYPDDTECARRLASMVELRLGEELTVDEVAYLALHVARLRPVGA